MRMMAWHCGGSGWGVLVVGAAALALAGCETYGGLGARPTGNVAEVEVDTSGASSANIASLSDVIQRNPNDSVAYNTRGAAYAKIGRYQNAIDDFSKAVQIDPNFAGAYTNRALAYRQIQRTVSRWPISTRRWSPIPITRRPISGAPICCARRAICPRRSPTSIRRSGSTPKARRPFTRAG